MTTNARSWRIGKELPSELPASQTRNEPSGLRETDTAAGPPTALPIATLPGLPAKRTSKPGGVESGFRSSIAPPEQLQRYANSAPDPEKLPERLPIPFFPPVT